MKISKWWCIHGESDEGKKFYDFLSKLAIGDLFIYKVHSRVGSCYSDNKPEYVDQFALMVRTGMMMFGDNDDIYYENKDSLIDQSILTSYYDFADVGQQRHSSEEAERKSNDDIFSSLHDSKLILKLGILGLKPEDLPLFEIEYDDRNIIFDKDNHMMVVF